jgi:tetratricopeptide (TPR) repeat protein
MNHRKGFSRFLAASFLIFSLFLSGARGFAQTVGEANSSTTSSTNTEISDAQALLRSNLLVQEQLHNALRAIEQARQDADAAAKRNADIFNERLSQLEKGLAEQRAVDLESMRNSNRSILMAGSILGAVGILALLCTAFFQVRALNRVAEVSSMLSTIPQDSPRALGQGDSMSPVRLGSAEQSNARFIAAIEQLEKKIHQLDSVNLHSSFQPEAPKADAASSSHIPGAGLTDRNGRALNGSESSEMAARVNLLLTEGQALLDGGDADNALVYFEQALDLEPNNTDALLKKGATLEALRKLTEAIETYDRVIATDSSITVAYLYKGGVLNRLQRFAEAMECYEKALKTHPKSLA